MNAAFIGICLLWQIEGILWITRDRCGKNTFHHCKALLSLRTLNNVRAHKWDCGLTTSYTALIIAIPP